MLKRISGLLNFMFLLYHAKDHFRDTAQKALCPYWKFHFLMMCSVGVSVVDGHDLQCEGNPFANPVSVA